MHLVGFLRPPNQRLRILKQPALLGRTWAEVEHLLGAEHARTSSECLARDTEARQQNAQDYCLA